MTFFLFLVGVLSAYHLGKCAGVSSVAKDIKNNVDVISRMPTFRGEVKFYINSKSDTAKSIEACRRLEGLINDRL